MGKRSLSIGIFVILFSMFVYAQSLIVTVYPDFVARGSTLYINIDPTGEFYNTAYIYKEEGANDVHVDSIPLDCEEHCSRQMQIEKVIPIEWEPGDYYVTIFDYYIKNYNKSHYEYTCKHISNL